MSVRVTTASALAYEVDRLNRDALMAFVADGGHDVFIYLYADGVEVRVCSRPYSALGAKKFSYTHSGYTLAENINEWMARNELKGWGR